MSNKPKESQPTAKDGSYPGHDNPNHAGLHSHEKRSENAKSSSWGQTPTKGEDRTSQSKQPKAPGWW